MTQINKPSVVSIVKTLPILIVCYRQNYLHPLLLSLLVSLFQEMQSNFHKYPCFFVIVLQCLKSNARRHLV